MRFSSSTTSGCSARFDIKWTQKIEFSEKKGECDFRWSENVFESTERDLNQDLIRWEDPRRSTKTCLIPAFTLHRIWRFCGAIDEMQIECLNQRFFLKKIFDYVKFCIIAAIVQQSLKCCRLNGDKEENLKLEISCRVFHGKLNCWTIVSKNTSNMKLSRIRIVNQSNVTCLRKNVSNYHVPFSIATTLGH